MRHTAVAIEGISPLPYAETVVRARQALAAEGFGVMTEIDFAAKMKEKLGADLSPYLILGACHPPSALKAFRAVPEVGVLLPCNVCVSVEGGKTFVRAMDPAPVMGLIGNQELAPVGAEVRAALTRVIQACENGA
jgi:uncharacterized protein (DUF302 family)